MQDARVYAAGEAEGAALVLSEPLSFWGGIDVTTGRIIDRSHPGCWEVRHRVHSRHARWPRFVVLLLCACRIYSEGHWTRRNRDWHAGPDSDHWRAGRGILVFGECPIVVCPIDGFSSGDRVTIRAGVTGHAQVDILGPAR